MSSLAGAAQRSQLAEVLAILNEHSTDEYGVIEFVTDGDRLWLRFTGSEEL